MPPSLENINIPSQDSIYFSYFNILWLWSSNKIIIDRCVFPNEENRNRANLRLAVLEETKENKIVSNVNCVVAYKTIIIV